MLLMVTPASIVTATPPGSRSFAKLHSPVEQRAVLQAVDGQAGWSIREGRRKFFVDVDAQAGRSRTSV
jgi:hypothetical protein